MNALVLVDIQNDFLPGGALAVRDGDKILPVVNALLKLPFDHVIATKDWHPKDHGSFADVHGKKVGQIIKLQGIEQILWPVHCVQGSYGAEFSDQLHKDKIEEVFLKGIDKTCDSYSTFFDNGHKRSTGLEKYLLDNGVDTVYIAGLATDYCVKYSVMDAIKLGFTTYVITDAIKGVNISPNDSEKSLFAMKEAGAHLIKHDEIHL